MDAASFMLADQPLDVAALSGALQGPEVGALAVFEGRVRRTNLGRQVLRLEYEAAPELAEPEFERLANEIRDRFEILDLRCVHRTGSLEIGDCAVWIGVTAAHREPAFDACRMLIDELKHRLPIWKKEHYADGDSGWIGHP